MATLSGATVFTSFHHFLLPFSLISCDGFYHCCPNCKRGDYTLNIAFPQDFPNLKGMKISTRTSKQNDVNISELYCYTCEILDSLYIISLCPGSYRRQEDGAEGVSGGGGSVGAGGGDFGDSAR